METSAGPTGLRWGVKQSFSAYLARMPDGRMSVTGGATLTDDQEVVWPPELEPETSTADGADRFFAFRGDVRYGAHGGLLFVQVADPQITLRGDSGEMTVLDTFSKPAGARIPLVTFTIDALLRAAGLELVQANDVRLTESGTHLFNEVYPAGEAFEPLTIIWPTDPT